jgi:elongation factor P--beta-lysine ligase
MPDKERQERRYCFVPDKDAQEQRHRFEPEQKQRDKTGGNEWVS